MCYGVVMTKAPRKLIVPRESYRLWFEFYKLSLLSTDSVIKSNLNKSTDYYNQWGDIKNIKFDDWWKNKSYLFAEHQVRLLEDPEDRQSDESLILEVPLNQSTTNLIQEIKRLIDANRPATTKKRKVVFAGTYQMTDGSEPKLKTIKDVLNIYRDVYLVNNRPKIRILLDQVEKYYKSKKRMVLPKSLDTSISDNSPENVLRNLGRWMNWGDKILENVSLGQFPGKY